MRIIADESCCVSVQLDRFAAAIVKWADRVSGQSIELIDRRSCIEIQIDPWPEVRNERRTLARIELAMMRRA